MSRTNLATAALLLIAVLIAGKIAAEQVALRRFVRVEDSRMAPAVPAGALAGLELVLVQDVAIGDVLLYANPNVPGPPVLVRVREELAPRGSRGTGRLLRLQSDADRSAATPPWDAELHGFAWRLSMVVPGAGWVARFDPQAVIRGAVIAACGAVVLPVLLPAVRAAIRRARRA